MLKIDFTYYPLNWRKNVLVLVSKTAIHKENKCRDQKSYLCPESYAIEQKSEVQK